MPVDMDFEMLWPVYYRTFETDDATPVVTVLAAAPDAGDGLLVPEMTVLGRNRAGADGNALYGSYTAVNGAGVLVARTNMSFASVYGAGGLTILVAVVGTELRVTTTGAVGVDAVWDVFWRMLASPLPAA